MTCQFYKRLYLKSLLCYWGIKDNSIKDNIISNENKEIKEII